jgi:hypothetical protein
MRTLQQLQSSGYLVRITFRCYTHAFSCRL